MSRASRRGAAAWAASCGVLLSGLAVMLGACGDDAGARDDEDATASVATTSTAVSGAGGGAGGAGGSDANVPDLPPGIMPCDEPEHWPLTLASTRFPLLVHYRASAEETEAARVLDALETSWAAEIEELGFRAPLPDDGACGPDGAFDVFLYRGIEECYVDVLAENPSTTWDDWTAYMVVDPWGPYGGDILRSTLAHELNHAMQATDDWFDSAIVYEMTATFVEEAVFDEFDVFRDLLEDFQTHPDWALDYDDGYETWYMYGAALYLLYVRDRFFEGDASFAGDLWYRMRSDPGTAEPDFADAMDQILTPFGSSYAASVVEHARWRWFTGARDDGRHFEEGADFPDSAEVPVTTIPASATEVALDPAPMLTGSAYFEIVPGSDDPVALDFTLEAPADPEVRWVVQIVPGDDGEFDELDVASGPARIELEGGAAKMLVVTAAPAGPYDPDERSDERRPATVRLGAP